MTLFYCASIGENLYLRQWTNVGVYYQPSYPALARWANRRNSCVGPTLLTLSHCDVWVRVYFTTKQWIAFVINRSRTGKIQVYMADRDVKEHRL